MVFGFRAASSLILTKWLLYVKIKNGLFSAKAVQIDYFRRIK